MEIFKRTDGKNSGLVSPQLCQCNSCWNQCVLGQYTYGGIWSGLRASGYP